MTTGYGTGPADLRSTGVMAALTAPRLPDPYPRYREIQRAGAFIDCDLAGATVTLVTRLAEASTVLTHPALGHGYRDGISYRGAPEDGLSSLLRADPPDHARLRRLVGKAFTAQVIGSLVPEITGLVDTLLDKAIAQGEVDAIEAFARPMPLRVMCQLLGVPPSDEEQFGAWADALTRGIDPPLLLTPDETIARNRATAAFDEYFLDLIARRRKAPREDLLSRLVAIHDGGDVLSGQELLELCTLLLVAGYETTVHLISGGILALTRNPDQLEAVRASPGLVGPAVEEMLRYDPPVQFIARTVLADTEIGGHTFTRGQGAIIMVGATNRDPTAFDQPDRFLAGRYAGPGRARRHLGFGTGIHYCLGAPLARIEAEIAFRALLNRVRSFTLTEDTLAYRNQIVIRGVEKLPLRLAA